MDDDRKKQYEKIAEKIFSKPPAERRRYLKEIKNKDLEYYERIEYLIRFITSREEDLDDYAHTQIKRMLDDLHSEDDDE